MRDPFGRFGGMSAIIVGALSILYAIFYLVIAPRAAYVGTLGSWLILGASGIFTSAAFVALYTRMKSASEGQALWAALLGVGSSFATLAHGAYEALLVSPSTSAPSPSQTDPAGLASFFVVGIVTFAFAQLIVRSGVLPRNLGYLGMFNSLLLVILFFANVASAQTLILISGGLTSVIVGPIWWVWLGRELMKVA
ncbi:MAG TPA: hypothetical protein VIK33_05135 [Anaerolineae bacterium]